jgi:hypothetical protein
LSVDIIPSTKPVGAKASFAAAAFALVLIVVFALERIGAPDRLVAALGPLAALVGIAAIGVLARARNLLEFLVAHRAAPASYAGLALAATAGGLTLALAASNANVDNLPWRGMSAGVVIAVLVVGPRWRAEQASGISDVFATHFPSAFTRVAFMVLSLACGWALAAAGLGYAALSVRDALSLSGNTAILICAGVLVLTLAPGGLRSLVWADAASAGAGLAIIGLFVALAFRGGSDPAARLEAAETALLGLPYAPLVTEIAATAATASLFAFATPALSVASPGAARRAGLVALLALALGAAAAGSLGDLAVKTPSDSALVGMVAFLPAMALARAGLFAASRPLGFDLIRVHALLSVLASRRIAIARAAVVIGAAIAAVVARVSPHPSAPLYLALGLWLAFAAPSLALTLISGRSSRPAIAALVASVSSALAARLHGFGNPSFGPELLVGALGAGLVGLAAGMIVRVLAPGRTPSPRLADPFVDLPLEA